MRNQACETGRNHRSLTVLVVMVTWVTTRAQPAFHAYSWGLLLTAACAAILLGAGGGLTAEPPLWGVVGVAVLTALPWAVQGGERVAVTLIHLPILAAVFLCSPVVAPLLAGTLAAIDNRAFGRAVAISSAGGYAIAAAAAVWRLPAGLVGRVSRPTPATTPGSPRHSSPPRRSSW